MYTQESFDKMQEWEAELERIKIRPEGQSCLSWDEEQALLSERATPAQPAGVEEGM